MIRLKTTKELSLMRESGRIAARALKLAIDAVKPGVSTEHIDSIVYKYIKSHGAVPSCLNYNGFPATCCISVNEEVIHGIPSSNRIIHSGDIVSIDFGVCLNNFHADNAYTVACGEISSEAQKLLDTTKQSLFQAIKVARVGNRIGDIGSTVEKYAESRGYSVVRDFVGHGVGTQLHEDPSVPNFGKAGHGARLLGGMTIAIEPMVNMGSSSVEVLDDGWTVLTADRKLSAHFEHTVAITPDGPIILTDPN